MKDFLTYSKLKKTVDRNLLMAESLENRYSNENDVEGSKKVKPDDLVRIYEILIQVPFIFSNLATNFLISKKKEYN